VQPRISSPASVNRQTSHQLDPSKPNTATRPLKADHVFKQHHIWFAAQQKWCGAQVKKAVGPRIGVIGTTTAVGGRALPGVEMELWTYAPDAR